MASHPLLLLTFKKKLNASQILCACGGEGGGGVGGGCLEFSLVLHHFQLLHFDPQKFGLK